MDEFRYREFIGEQSYEITIEEGYLLSLCEGLSVYGEMDDGIFDPEFMWFLNLPEVM